MYRNFVSLSSNIRGWRAWMFSGQSRKWLIGSSLIMAVVDSISGPTLSHVRVIDRTPTPMSGSLRMSVPPLKMLCKTRTACPFVLAFANRFAKSNGYRHVFQHEITRLPTGWIFVKFYIWSFYLKKRQLINCLYCCVVDGKRGHDIELVVETML
jgi:hypothetical protein